MVRLEALSFTTESLTVIDQFADFLPFVPLVLAFISLGIAVGAVFAGRK